MFRPHPDATTEAILESLLAKRPLKRALNVPQKTVKLFLFRFGWVRRAVSTGDRRWLMTDGADTVSSRSRVLLVMGNIAVAVDECVLSLDFANAIKK